MIILIKRQEYKHNSVHNLSWNQYFTPVFLCLKIDKSMIPAKILFSDFLINTKAGVSSLESWFSKTIKWNQLFWILKIRLQVFFKSSLFPGLIQYTELDFKLGSGMSRFLTIKIQIFYFSFVERCLRQGISLSYIVLLKKV